METNYGKLFWGDIREKDLQESLKKYKEFLGTKNIKYEEVEDDSLFLGEFEKYKSIKQEDNNNFTITIKNEWFEHRKWIERLKGKTILLFPSNNKLTIYTFIGEPTRDKEGNYIYGFNLEGDLELFDIHSETWLHRHCNVVTVEMTKEQIYNKIKDGENNYI